MAPRSFVTNALTLQQYLAALERALSPELATLRFLAAKTNQFIANTLAMIKID